MVMPEMNQTRPKSLMLQTNTEVIREQNFKKSRL